MREIRQSLSSLGFWPKEIDVYLAMLELGPASVQDISKRAGIQRTTTYTILETFRQKQFLHTLEQGNKQLYSLASPDRLKGHLQAQQRELEGKTKSLEQIMPQLMALFNALDEKPKVRYFEGEGELRWLRQEIMDMGEPIWEFYAVDKEALEIAETHREERIELSAQAKQSRLLLICPPDLLPAYFDRSGFEVRELSENPYPFKGSMTVCGEKLFILASKTPGMGVILESKDMANLFKTLYELAWNQAKKWHPPADWRR